MQSDYDFTDAMFVFSVYSLISRRRFQQMDVLENQNILVTISGKKNKIRVYYLSWLKSKIFKTEGVSQSVLSLFTAVLLRKFILLNNFMNNKNLGSVHVCLDASNVNWE